MRPIDADELMQKYCGECDLNEMFCLNCKYHELRVGIKNAPTIETKSVKRGEWIDNGEDKFICSACKGYVYRWFGKSDFCPRCGARIY